MVSAGYEDTEEWELVNDDGFVYRRKKRRRLLEPIATASLVPPDPEAERRKWLQRRKRVLQKLRDKYRTEISHWELLSNTLRGMEKRAKVQSAELPSLTESERTVSELPQQPASDRCCRSITEELLTQVETQEAIIQDVSKMCDVAEALCNAQEKKRKQQLLNLPIWDTSPHELMTVLSEP